MTWDREVKVKWKSFEIEKWNFSTILEYFQRFKKDRFGSIGKGAVWIKFFMKLGVKFQKKGDIFFPFTLFEKWKWNKNDWKSRSRSKSEIKNGSRSRSKINMISLKEEKEVTKNTWWKRANSRVSSVCVWIPNPIVTCNCKISFL